MAHRQLCTTPVDQPLPYAPTCPVPVRQLIAGADQILGIGLAHQRGASGCAGADIVCPGHKGDLHLYRDRCLQALVQCRLVGTDLLRKPVIALKPVAELLKLDRQVGRRFSKIHLPQVTFTSDGEALQGLLRAFSDRVGLDVEIEDDLIHCLIAAAQSQFGLAIEISIGAIEMALGDGSSKLSRRSFIDYWGMQEGCALEGNVFWTNRFGEVQDVITTGTANTTKRRGRK